MTSQETVVHQFNVAINARDLEALTRLMTESHRFIDGAGRAIEGKSACVAAWRGFFEAFPDYENCFEHVETIGDDVVVRGYSRCSVRELDGPALWFASVENGLIEEWRVYDDTPENRCALGIG